MLFAPAGGGGYAELAPAARTIGVTEELEVLVASRDDLIRMKEAANRPKDQLVLPILRWLKTRLPGEPGAPDP